MGMMAEVSDSSFSAFNACGYDAPKASFYIRQAVKKTILGPAEQLLLRLTFRFSIASGCQIRYSLVSAFRHGGQWARDLELFVVTRTLVRSGVRRHSEGTERCLLRKNRSVGFLSIPKRDSAGLTGGRPIDRYAWTI